MDWGDDWVERCERGEIVVIFHEQAPGRWTQMPWNAKYTIIGYPHPRRVSKTREKDLFTLQR